MFNSFLTRDSVLVRDYYIQTILNDAKDAMGDNISNKDLLHFLIEDSDYFVRKYVNSKRTLWNRLNCLWVYPLFTLTIPFQWLILGEKGVKVDSKLGRLLQKLVNLN